MEVTIQQINHINMKKITILIGLFWLVLAAYSQKLIPPTFPNGWHIGITGEVNLAQRMSVIPLVI